MMNTTDRGSEDSHSDSFYPPFRPHVCLSACSCVCMSAPLTDIQVVREYAPTVFGLDKIFD